MGGRKEREEGREKKRSREKRRMGEGEEKEHERVCVREIIPIIVNKFYTRSLSLSLSLSL